MRTVLRIAATCRWLATAATVWALAAFAAQEPGAAASQVAQPAPQVVPGPADTVFLTSHECLACHNGLTTAGGEDVSIGVAWRASMMANSSRDP
jgi:hypothetical protein